MGSDESHFNVSLIERAKVTRQCPQTTTFLKRKVSRSGIEPGAFLLTSLTPYRCCYPWVLKFSSWRCRLSPRPCPTSLCLAGPTQPPPPSLSASLPPPFPLCLPPTPNPPSLYLSPTPPTPTPFPLCRHPTPLPSLPPSNPPSLSVSLPPSLCLERAVCPLGA